MVIKANSLWASVNLWKMISWAEKGIKSSENEKKMNALLQKLKERV